MEVNKLDFVSFRRKEGYYNLCNPREKSAQYIFDYGKYKNLAKEYGVTLNNILIPIEDDIWFTCNNENTSVYDLVYELSDYIDGFFVHTKKKEIKHLLRFLELIRFDNEYERLVYHAHYYEEKLKGIEAKLRKSNNLYCELCGNIFDQDCKESDLLNVCEKCKAEMIEPKCQENE